MSDHRALIEDTRANLLHPGALDGMLKDEIQGRLLRLADALEQEAIRHVHTGADRDNLSNWLVAANKAVVLAGARAGAAERRAAELRAQNESLRGEAGEEREQHREMYERQAAAVRHHTDRADALARDLAAAVTERDENFEILTRQIATIGQGARDLAAAREATEGWLGAYERRCADYEALQDQLIAALTASPQDAPQRTVAGSQAAGEAP